MDDDIERLKMKMAVDEGEDVEGHKMEPTEDERLKMKMAVDEGEDVEGHKMEPESRWTHQAEESPRPDHGQRHHAPHGAVGAAGQTDGSWANYPAWLLATVRYETPTLVAGVGNCSGLKPWNGAAQESNLPSRGLHDRTGFEDRLGHRARAAPQRD